MGKSKELPEQQRRPIQDYLVGFVVSALLIVSLGQLYLQYRQLANGTHR